MSAAGRRLLVWGAGELGGRVAAGWTAGPAIGFTRGTSRHEVLRAVGVAPQTGDPLAELKRDDVLLLSLPGHETQGEAVERLANRPVPHRALLISTTGYYGRRVTGVVQEGTPVGNNPRSQSIAAVEIAFRRWAGDRGVILRLGGLYGPGRGPVAALARRGYPRPGPANRILPLIHYDDAAAAALAALARSRVEPVYLGVVAPAPTRGLFYRRVCAALGLPAPAFTAPMPWPPAHFDDTFLRRDLLPAPAHSWEEVLRVG